MPLLTLIALAALASPPAAQATWAACPKGSGYFVLYYGDPIGPDALRIVATKPNFVILGRGLETRRDVPAYYQSAGIRAIAYVATGYSRRSFVERKVKQAMASGFDGVFFDEVDAKRHSYNSELAALVKKQGDWKLVIMNTGMSHVDAELFKYADIVSVENRWHKPVPALPGVEAWRWLAVQGDPAQEAPRDKADAAERLETFRKLGGFWYYASPYSTRGPTHVRLPSWFEEFAAYAGGATAVTPCDP